MPGPADRPLLIQPNDKVSNDDNSHGTYVAGNEVAEGNNGVDNCGAAWSVKIMQKRLFRVQDLDF